MLLAECWLQNKRYYFPFYGFEFIERLWMLALLPGIEGLGTCGRLGVLATRKGN